MIWDDNEKSYFKIILIKEDEKDKRKEIASPEKILISDFEMRFINYRKTILEILPLAKELDEIIFTKYPNLAIPIDTRTHSEK
jgi:hypothetical protein